MAVIDDEWRTFSRLEFNDAAPLQLAVKSLFHPRLCLRKVFLLKPSLFFLLQKSLKKPLPLTFYLFLVGCTNRFIDFE